MEKRPLPFDPIAEARRQWERHGWAAASQMAAVTSMMRAQQWLISELNLLLKPFSLTFARYEALVLLYFTRSGALPLARIGERLLVHPASVTNTIDRLEDAKLVRRIPHPSDGRATLAEITDAGRQLVEQATKELVAVGFRVDALPEAGLDTLTSLIGDLRVAAGDFAPEDERHREEKPGNA
ncbi:MAG: MarR family transcriptional regulator [Dehalococcoidia bacterium]